MSSFLNLKMFECLKVDHASLLNEKIVTPCIETPKANPPNCDSNWMDFACCETCHGLLKEIEFLTQIRTSLQR